MQVKLPWHDTNSCSPANTSAATRLPRGTVRDISRFDIFRATNILNPFLVEIPGIEVMHHHYAGYLSVACVGWALPMRAIAGNSAVHIIGLTSSPDFIDLVKKGIRGLKSGGNLDVSMDNFSGYLSGQKFPGPVADFNPAKNKPVKTCGMRSRALTRQFLKPFPSDITIIKN